MKRTVEHKATPLECPYILSTDDLKSRYASIKILQGDGFGNLSIIRVTLPQLEEFIKDLKSLSIRARKPLPFRGGDESD